MESPSFFFGSQPTTSTAQCVFPEFVQGPSYLEPSPPTTDPRLRDATNLLGLRLPPNTLRALAQGQASGRLPALFNGPAGQPVRIAKAFATAKRTAGRAHSQPQMWKTGSTSAYARGVSAARQARQGSQLADVALSQPPPVKARARRAARAGKSTARDTTSIVPCQNAITMSSQGGDQIEATSFPVYTGLSAVAGPSAASWGGEVEGTSMSALEPLEWATATAADISKRCGLDSLPLALIDQVLPMLRAYLAASGSSTSTSTETTNTAQFPAPSVSGGLTVQSQWSSGMETSELLPATQLLPQFQLPAQPSMPSPPIEEPTTEAQATALTGTIPDFEPTEGIAEWPNVMEWIGWAPQTGPSVVEERTAEPLSEADHPWETFLAPEELDAPIRDQDSAVVEPALEEPSAALEFLLELEHGLEMEAGRWEFPMAPPTRDDMERSMPLGEGMDMGALANLDAGQLLDGWEGWA